MSSASVGPNNPRHDDNQYSSGEENDFDDFDSMDTDFGLVNAEGVDMDAAEAYIANPANSTSDVHQSLSSDWHFNDHVSLGADALQGVDQSSFFRTTGNAADLTLSGADLDGPLPTPSSDPWVGGSHRGSLDMASLTPSHDFDATCINAQGSEQVNLHPDLFNPSSATAVSLPDSNSLEGPGGKIHFTLTMNGASVQTMQSLMEIAIQTHARFRVERE